MKKLINYLLGFLLLCPLALAEVSDITSPGTITLTSTCTNAHTTCDTAGVTNFNVNSPFSVQGPQTIEVTTQGYGLATISATGTYTGSTLNFEFSDDGGNTWYAEVCTRTDANIQEASEVLPTNATEAWDCGVGAATKFRVRQSALSTGGPNVRITLTQGLLEPAPSVAISQTVGSTDPCQNAGVLKSSVAVSVSSATTTQLVALSAGKTIYVCGGVISSVGGTSTLEYGTGSSCGTGTTVLTGAFPAASTVPLGSGMTLFPTASGNALCILSGASTTATAGFITYVQQ